MDRVLVFVYLCLLSLTQWQIQFVIQQTIAARAPSQYMKRRLPVRSRKVSKPRDWNFKLSNRLEIWQAHRQHCCRSACQISERSDNSKYKSRDFETLRDLTERRLFGYWDGALNTAGTFSENTSGIYQISILICIKYCLAMAWQVWPEMIHLCQASAFHTRLMENN